LRHSVIITRAGRPGFLACRLYRVMRPCWNGSSSASTMAAYY